MSIYKPWLVVCLGTFSLWGCSTTPLTPTDALNTLATDLQRKHESVAQVDLALSEQDRRARIDEILRDPIQPAQAMELLLINSAQVRAQLAGLGIAQAQRLQAGLVGNPTFALGALRPEGGGRWQLDAGISQSLLDLFTRPLRTRLAEAELVAAQLELSEQLNHQLYNVQRFYYRALSARQLQQLQSAQLQGAEANYSLALSLYDAGNIPERALLQYQLEAQAQARQLQQANVSAQQSRIALAGILGLAANTKIQLPENLPALPVEDNFSSASLYQNALTQRGDLQLARAQLNTAERNLALQQKTGSFTELELGANLERETDGSYMAGPEIAFSLPIFDRGYARRYGAAAAITRSHELVKAKEIEIATEIASALLTLTSARATAEQIQTHSLPLQRKVQAIKLREYNFMLGSAFDLIALKQQEFALQAEFVDAVLSYWLARSELALASGQSLMPDPDAPIQEQSPPQLVAPEIDHSQHTDHSMHHHGGHHD